MTPLMINFDKFILRDYMQNPILFKNQKGSFLTKRELILLN